MSLRAMSKKVQKFIEAHAAHECEVDLRFIRSKDGYELFVYARGCRKREEIFDARTVNRYLKPRVPAMLAAFLSTNLSMKLSHNRKFRRDLIDKVMPHAQVGRTVIFQRDGTVTVEDPK